MINLYNKLNGIVDLITDKNDVVFLEYPLYLNVGDLLIYHGVEELFKANNINVKYRVSLEEYNANLLKDVISETTTIIFQGGGNFGDLYNGKQGFREEIVKKFKNNRIVILPQTIHFESKSNMLKSSEIFSEHNDLHICCRDEVSEKLFGSFSKNVYKFPDTAHRLIKSLKTKTRSKDSLFFIRVDKEKFKGEHKSKFLACDYNSVDWKDILRTHDYVIQYAFSKLSKFNKILGSKILNKVIWKLWFNYSFSLVNRCSEYFSEYNTIITSRLHGHILTCLVNRESKVIDNSYGKNSRYCSAWTSHLNNVEYEEFKKLD
ncbi:polysaccharide pyruvyl transferase family protein [Vibrio fluvialis]|uniref:polysaccharide pyruvyl transferase family protein n=1 Tax=Vibrio fluvialis TaxID=676 RepID=UPI0006E27C62|nr:polysaccharide pyruvyl transferase family protein [Vibrio fluvialis]KQH89133.1 hypothetical protein AMR75_14380 [Vibrio fluvialis]